MFSNFADSAAACRLNKQTAPLTTKSDIQSLFYRFAPSRVRVPKSYCHKKTAARTVFFMASAAGLPACFLISPTALPLVGSISKRRRSQRKVTFSHFSIGLRPLGFESQNHIAIKKPPQGRFFMASAAGLEPTAPGLGNLCSILMSYADLKQERIITALFTKSIILRHLSTISDWPPRF